MTDEEILKDEVTLILEDIKSLYEQSGKKVSEQFPGGLEAVYTPYSATIRGYVYLAGRKSGKAPPVSAIQEWVKNKGIFQIKSNAEARSLAFAIAKKIAKSGTSKEYELKIYEQVITPTRINQIFQRVAQINVNRIVTQLQIELEVLAKNV